MPCLKSGLPVRVAMLALFAAASTMALLTLPESRLNAAGAPSAKTTVPSSPKQPPPAALPEPDRSVPLAQQYCESVRDAAVEARFAFQTEQLAAAARELEGRIAQLDARTNELKQWISRRDEFSSLATTQLVGIYSAMRPEAASEQFVRLNQTTAAAILSKLEQRAASAILNEMPPDKAAKLTSIMAEVAQKERSGAR